ncbi:MAG: response regulator [Ignavibacteriales bacterium]|nr:MAG: response regulator [Ignavibacteriales bacterium]
MDEKDKILIVEDEEDTRYILDRLLSKNNYEVKTAVNGEDAIKCLADFKPKVIIADWTMPIIDGIELCNIIKKDERYKLIYYILLTARASLKDRITGLDIGADEFLVKPIENQELLARIRSGIRIHNLQEELTKIEHNKAVLTMATTIGHQINNPLGSLVLTLNGLESELKKSDKEKFEEDFKLINEAIERIKKFVGALTNLQNPEVVGYTDESKMIKL